MTSKQKITKQTFTVKGMDCASCSTKVEKAVSRIPGVQEANVSFTSEKLTVSSKTAFPTEKIRQAIENLGYQITENNLKEIILFVEGMDCQDEVELVEKRLKPLDGIVSFKPNLMSQKLAIAYYSRDITAEEIIRELDKSGLRANIEKPRPAIETKPWWRELKLILLVLSGLITLATFISQQLGAPEVIADSFFGLAILIGSYYPVKMALAGLRSFTLNIRLLMILGAVGAVSLDLWEEAALLVFIYLLGDVLEVYAVDKARGSIRALMELAPPEALVKRNGTEKMLPVEEVRIGDTIIIRPGEKIPLDGKVTNGSSTIDQAPITGESMPVAKKAGGEVFAGTINQRGALEITVTKLAKDTTLAKIIHLVEEAQAKKSKYQRFAEKFGKYYTPSMFGLAIAIATIPPIAFGQDFSAWYLRGLVVLVVSCSCGLALSVPVAVVAAIANAARNGILIKGGTYLEVASGIKVIAFDKTGTLTIGRPQVTDVVPLNTYPQKEILRIAAAIESRSEHPLAGAVLEEAERNQISLPEIEAFQSFTGLGAKGRVNGELYRIGNRQFFDDLALKNNHEEQLAKLEGQGKTAVLLGNQSELLGVIAVADQLRPHVRETIAQLKSEGIKRTVMLTGDNKRTAAAIAAQVGVDEYLADLLPEEKVEAINKLKERYGKVAMIGDGVNDAPAMAVADVGITMGSGTDVALETGDLALMADELPKISYALHLSQRSVRNIKQNIGASLAIVAFLVPAALIGVVSLVSGILLNEVSALIVIVNGLRLLR